MSKDSNHWASGRIHHASEVVKLLSVIESFSTNRVDGNHQKTEVLAKFEEMKSLLSKLPSPFKPDETMDVYLEKDSHLTDYKTTTKYDKNKIQTDDSTVTDTEVPDAIKQKTRDLYFVLGVKDGIIQACETIFGGRVKSVTHSPLGKAKKIDDYSIYDVIEAIKEASSPPTHADKLQQKMNFLSTSFNWTYRLEVNLSMLLDEAERLKEEWGVEITHHDMALVIMKEVEAASSQPWGQPLATPLSELNGTVAHEFIHTDISLNKALELLKKYDKTRNIRDAPSAPVSNVWNNVAESAAQSEDMHYYGADYADDRFSPAPSVARSRGRSHQRGSSSSRRSHRSPSTSSSSGGSSISASSSDRSRSPSPAPELCHFCRKYNRLKGHYGGPEQCFFNPRNYKKLGEREEWVKRVIDKAKRDSKEDKKKSAKKDKKRSKKDKKGEM
mmetsp:Transcript_1471/g.2186  ORF Transcript_1471/g.2186 Transcript_1471/m.2186 type:complete len:442 (-) Transcript_1471:126-1451(-)